MPMGIPPCSSSSSSRDFTRDKEDNLSNTCKVMAALVRLSSNSNTTLRGEEMEEVLVLVLVPEVITTMIPDTSSSKCCSSSNARGCTQCSSSSSNSISNNSNNSCKCNIYRMGEAVAVEQAEVEVDST